MRALAVVALALLAGCQAEQPARDDAVTGNGIMLVSDAIKLPDETAALPAGHDLVAVNCTACHSTEMLTTQPRLSAEKWQATIDKMRTVYKAQIAPADDAALIAELTALPTQR